MEQAGQRGQGRHRKSQPVAWRPLLAVAAALVAVLVALSGRYGYHRDELYFLVLGDHPAWGYVDQPPLVPLLAGALDGLAPGSLTVLRVPSALAAGATSVVAGLTAAALGAGRRAQLLAAASLAVGTVTLGAGHLLSTTPFDVLAWSVVTWAAVRAVAEPRWWLVAGLAAGVGAQVKTLVGFLVVAVAVGLLVAGPRRGLRTPYPWAAGLLALALAAPNLAWQAANGWPQIDLAAAIADGSSGTSASPWVFVPFQLVLVSPFLAPVWLVGLVRLLRGEALRPWRFLGVAYVVLVVVFVATGGKPYYLAGTFPLLLAAGAQPVVDWAGRAAGRTRAALVVAAVALSGAVGSVLFLPVLPVGSLAATPVVDVNYDAGETVGWPSFAGQVERAWRAAPAGSVVLTGNYGELGALARYAPEVPAYSGHNSLGDLGPPPSATTSVVAVGVAREDLAAWFRVVRPVARIDNGLGLDNDEQGATVWECRGPAAPWSELWPRVSHLG